MKSVKILLSLFAAFALSVISEEVSDISDGSRLDYTIKIAASVLMVSSFMYLHYMFHSYLHPYEKLLKEQKYNITQATKNYYQKSFFRGAVGIGYIVLLASIIPMFGANTEVDIGSYLVIAVLFVIVGTASKVRGLILCLLDEKKYTHNQALQRTSR
jgi:hypothetical protein